MNRREFGTRSEIGGEDMHEASGTLTKNKKPDLGLGKIAPVHF